MSNCPDRLQLINATVTAGTSVTAIVAFTSVEHRDFYTLCNNILASSSGATGAELFSIQVGATGSTPAPVTYPVLNCLGENVQYGTLRAGMDLCLQFVSPDSTGTGSVPAHFRLKSPTCPLVLIPAGA